MPGPGGVTVDISSGTLNDVGPIYTCGKRDLHALFAAGWELDRIRHVEYMEELESTFNFHSEWVVIAEKMFN